MRRTCRKREHLDFFGDKRSDSRCGSSIGFSSKENLWCEYSIDNCTRRPRQNVLYACVQRKTAHLFFGCPFTRIIWNRKTILRVDATWETSFWASLQRSSSRRAEGVCILAVLWAIWLHWNDKLFSGRAAAIDSVACALEGFVAAWSSRLEGRGAYCNSLPILWVSHHFLGWSSLHFFQKKALSFLVLKNCLERPYTKISLRKKARASLWQFPPSWGFGGQKTWLREEEISKFSEDLHLFEEGAYNGRMSQNTEQEQERLARSLLSNKFLQTLTIGVRIWQCLNQSPRHPMNGFSTQSATFTFAFNNMLLWLYCIFLWSLYDGE